MSQGGTVLAGGYPLAKRDAKEFGNDWEPLPSSMIVRMLFFDPLFSSSV